jgi:3-hydroxyacyl-CoA dehydrogenase
MNRQMPSNPVAIVGSGVIGRSWAVVFLRSGCPTALFDSDPGQLERAGDWIRLHRVDGPWRIRLCDSLAQALEGAEYVQECGPERLTIKQQLFADLDRTAPPDAILASSTSAFDMTEIARNVRHPRRCIVAHPVNPPHIIPVVEVLGGELTDSAIVVEAQEFLRALGQTPVLLKKHIHGFVLNRLQFALVREAVHLLKSGVADVAAIDAVVRDGLGLRWALLGPFAVADTNKDEGVRSYFGGYEEWITALMNQLGPTPTFDSALIEQIGQALDEARGETPREDVRTWRDRMIVEIRRMKAENPLRKIQEQPQ